MVSVSAPAGRRVGVELLVIIVSPATRTGTGAACKSGVPLLAGTAAGVVIGSVGIGVLASRRTPATNHATPMMMNATHAEPAPTFSPAPKLQSSLDEVDASAAAVELDTAAPIATVAASINAPRRRAAPIGTVHNGFTKLK